MPTLKQKLRQVEQAALRLTGDRRQAAALREKIERHLHQLAASHAGAGGRQQVAAVDEAQLLKSLVQFRRVGWVNMPGKGTRVLVERGTGCVLADSKGALILRPREKLPTKPAIKESVFLRHLKDSNVENFVPHMYRDTNGNVTVGIGELLRTADEAKVLTFTKRGTNIAASAKDIELDFNNVKTAAVSSKSKAPVYQQFTKLEFTEPRAEARALVRMREFLGFLRNTYFPEFDTYPVLVKMGLLDLAYHAGAKGARKTYKDFAAAMDRRNWKQAGIEQRDGRTPLRANIAQAWFNRAAQQEPFFISHTNCRKPLASLAK